MNRNNITNAIFTKEKNSRDLPVTVLYQMNNVMKLLCEN